MIAEYQFEAGCAIRRSGSTQRQKTDGLAVQSAAHLYLLELERFAVSSQHFPAHAQPITILIGMNGCTRHVSNGRRSRHGSGGDGRGGLGGSNGGGGRNGRGNHLREQRPGGGFGAGGRRLDRWGRGPGVLQGHDGVGGSFCMKNCGERRRGEGIEGRVRVVEDGQEIVRVW